MKYQFLQKKKWSTIINAALVTQAAPKQSCEDYTLVYVSVCFRRSEDLNKLRHGDGEAAFIKVVLWDFQDDFLYPTIL